MRQARASDRAWRSARYRGPSRRASSGSRRRCAASFLRRLAAWPPDSAASAEHRAIHIAERHDLDGRDLNEAEQIGLAVPAAADQPHTAGTCRDSGRDQTRRGETKGSSGGGVQKLAAIHAGVCRRTPGEKQLSGSWLQAPGFGCGRRTAVLRTTNYGLRVPAPADRSPQTVQSTLCPTAVTAFASTT